MSDPMVRHLARELAAMRNRIRAMEVASQAAFRSIEGGSIDVYDDETDELLGRIGVQPDGSVGVDIKASAKPQTPTEPDVVPIPGGAIVAWDGRFEDRQPWKAIDRVAVHMDETPGFTPDRDTEVGAIMSRHGGTVVIPVDDGAEWYVKLVAVSKGFVWSDPSTEVFVAAVESGEAHYQDEFTLTVDGAQDVTLTFEPEPFSEHLYWNGLYQQEDVAWTREELVVSLTDTPFPPRAGDRVVVEYAYVDDTKLSVPIGATWKYQAGGTENDTAKASASYDDSGWSSGPSSFGHGAGSPVGTDVPNNGDVWAVWTRLQARSYGGNLTFTIGVDWKGWVWVDGALAWSTNTSGSTSFTVSADAGVHTFAAYGWDNGWTNPGANGSALAVEIQEA